MNQTLWKDLSKLKYSMAKQIQIGQVDFDTAEEHAVLDVLRSGWIVQGPQVKNFEQKFGSFIGSRYCTAVSSCSTGLQTCLWALRVKPGDEILVPAYSWVATAHVVELCGAKPVFCDINLSTFNIDPEELSKRITKKTVGIIPVHLFGLCADMNRIMHFAESEGLSVLEDAACGLGASCNGAQAGTFGRAACFSFHPRKSITTGEGGMISTDDEMTDRLAKRMRSHGMIPPSEQTNMSPHVIGDCDEPGQNYRMTDIQAAIGQVQLEKFPDMRSRRIKVAKNYARLLSGCDWLILPSSPDGFEHAYQAYVILLNRDSFSGKSFDELHERRNRCLEFLHTKGVQCRPGTQGLPLLSYYKNKYSLLESSYSNSAYADRCSIALPMHSRLSVEDIEYVSQVIHEEFELE